MRAWILGSLLSLVVACARAISPAELDAVHRDVGARNDASLAAARASLEAKGYRFVRDDEARYASLEEDARAACRAMVLARYGAGAPALPPGDALRARVVTPALEGGPSHSPIVVSAPASELCAFFRGSGAELRVTRESGEAGVLVRAGGPRDLAVSPTGERVEVSLARRVVSRRAVLVERSCDHMPRVEPDPLDVPRPIPVRWGPSPPLRRVTVPFDREEVDVTCTENTY